MHPASEIAARIDTCVGNSYLEYHKLMAPTGRQLYIGPNYYFADQYCSSPTYSYTTRSNYYYNASNPTRMSTTSNWIWSIDGTKTSFTPITGQFISSSSNSTGTIIYTLQYKVGSATYNIAKIEVTYLDVNSVGPLETLTNNDVSGMDIIYENTFNYNKPNTTDLTWYDGHISIDESSYGYFYKDLISYHFVNGSYDDVYWSEYGFVNKHKSWYNESIYGYNHGSTNSETDAKDGYFLFCDGSENSGRIFSLNIDEELCAGSVMYFSAWVMDLSYYGSNNNPCAPNIDFVIVGIKDDGTENDITTFTTGEFGKAVSMETATWYQVLFPITFDNVNSKYDSYKIRINNKGKSASGNDFGFDDIRIYMQKLLLHRFRHQQKIVQRHNMIL